MEQLPHTIAFVEVLEGADGEIHGREVCANSCTHTFLRCKMCDKFSSDLLNYISHHLVVQHHPQNSVTCLLCQRIFSSRELLHVHYTAYHKLVLKDFCLGDQTPFRAPNQVVICTNPPDLAQEVVITQSGSCLDDHVQEEIAFAHVPTHTISSGDQSQKQTVLLDGQDQVQAADLRQAQEQKAVLSHDTVLLKDEKGDEPHVDHSYYRLEKKRACEGHQPEAMNRHEEEHTNEHCDDDTDDFINPAVPTHTTEEASTNHDSGTTGHSNMDNADVDDEDCCDLDEGMAVDAKSDCKNQVNLEDTDRGAGMESSDSKQPSKLEIILEGHAVSELGRLPENNILSGSSDQENNVHKHDFALRTSVNDPPPVQARNARNAVVLRTSDGRDVYVIEQCETSFSVTPSLEVTIKIEDKEARLDQSIDGMTSACGGDWEEVEEEKEEQGKGDHCVEKADDVLIGEGHLVTDSTEDDFQFISGLKHRRIHIAQTNVASDFGLQVFICLHCDFVSNMDGLVGHMKSVHKQILAQRKMKRGGVINSDCRMSVPNDRVFPQGITGEEVLWLSEYHKRNLEQKVKVDSKSKRKRRLPASNKKTMPGSWSGSMSLSRSRAGLVLKAEEQMKKYQETRMPCLCPQCGKIFYGKRSLRTHMKVHNQVRNHLCEVCGKAFRSATQLSQHRKTHLKKVFACDSCDFTSNYRMAIFDHQQLHPSKFLLCHVCGTVVKSKNALDRHMMVHSMSRPYPCTIEGCTWRFNSKVLRKGHVEAHRSRGKYVCLKCDRYFRKRHHARRHVMRVHSIVSKKELDSSVGVDSKAMPSPSRFGKLPVTQLSKQHIMITTDEQGKPIFGDDTEELVFEAKTL